MNLMDLSRFIAGWLYNWSAPASLLRSGRCCLPAAWFTVSAPAIGGLVAQSAQYVFVSAASLSCA